MNMNEILDHMNPLLQWIISQGIWRCIEHLIVFLVCYRVIRSILYIQSRGNLGLKNYLLKIVLRAVSKLGFVNKKKQEYLETEATKNANTTFQQKSVSNKFAILPQVGLKSNQLLFILDERIKADIDPTKGQTFAYVYSYSQQHLKITEQCFVKYLHYNALNPVLFNSLRVIENEVVKMCSNLFHGDDNCVGNMTSCGTQSLLLAMKTYRDWRGIGEVIMCTTGHPGINKGCAYVGLTPIQIPYDGNKRMSLYHLKKQISKQTIVVVCSAPQYPYGVVDDVPEIAKICQQYGVPLHVDSAIGGLILPFIEMEGKYKYKPWDFRVDGVTSINADIHKYGYSPKGSSVLIYKNAKIRRNQYFSFTTWPGGIYISPTALGTRNGGCLSSAWGSLLHLGIQGFRHSTRQILKLVQQLVNFINSHEQLQLMAEPDSTIVSFKTKNFSCYQLADAMEKRGIYLEKQSNPESIHMTLMPNHIGKMEQIVMNLKQSLIEIESDKKLYESGSKAMYGMMAQIPDQAIVEEFVVHYMDQVYRYR